MRIVEVDSSNVDSKGFFCYMSKKKSVGYQRKLQWLKARFDEGMKLKLLELPDRGFIEYIPGEYAWRAVSAPGYMVIHCLWVVGKSKGKGYAKQLLGECLRDAEEAGMHGVAMLTSEKTWLVGKKLFVSQGFEVVDHMEPSFSLMVKRFGDAELPTLIDNRERVKSRFPEGLTLFRSDQCPYIEDAIANGRSVAEKAGIECQVVELTTAAEVREFSPFPFGTFGMVLNGRRLSYHYLLEKELLPLLQVQ
ncbi:MAG: GNAT family N-acetyltransferase [Proteobacteria bacterium]|jgi:L-amino acid N-acyltransferase YncA|nr:GNAT family N-acetyltransferase [Pseudomonadota bacterium]